MSKRVQHHMAIAVGITPAFLSELKHGRKNASAPIADRLSIVTGSDIRLWLRGGSPSARRAAVELWAETAQQEK
jgi:plasmid maintenance system antidote protein VapI